MINHSHWLKGLLIRALYMCLAVTITHSQALGQSDGSPSEAGEPIAVSTADLLVPTLTGAALGALAGGYIGAASGLGGDDSGMVGAFLVGPIGGTLGAALGLELGSHGRLSTGRALEASLIGLVAGAAGSLVATRLARGNEWAAWVGFSVGQGTVAALVAPGR